MGQEVGGTPPFLPSPGGNDTQQLMQQILKLVGTPAPQGGGMPPVGAPGVTMPAPSPNIQFNPGGAPGVGFQTAPPRRPEPVPPTGNQGLGTFATKGAARNAGLTSLGNSLTGMLGAVEAKDHAKKAAMAENYLLQINSLIASGDPNDRKKAEMFLEDPKIRKILKTGLEFVPLEEKVPPEAEGVKAAADKIAKQGGGQQPPPQQMRPVMPQASTQQKLQQVMQNALLKKFQDDPAAAISAMGQSQLSSAEQHTAEIYEKRLGLSPVQAATMSLQDKMAGLKTLETSMRDILKTQVDIYKTDKAYSGRIDSSRLLADARKYAADRYKEAAAGKKGNQINLAAGAKIYKDMAQEYTTLAGKPDVKSEDKARYLQQADQYNKQADDYLNKVSEGDLMNEFMGAIEETPEETPPKEETPPN